MPEDRRTIPPEGDEREGTERNSIFERLVKKGIESGIGAFSKSEDAVRHVLDGMKLPKEATSVVLDQIDETKKGLYTVVAKEIRDFLRTTNFAGDVKKILTGLAFEVKMEVRFKPTDGEGDNASVRPDVSAQANLKSTRKRTRTTPTPDPDAPKDPTSED